MRILHLLTVLCAMVWTNLAVAAEAPDFKKLDSKELFAAIDKWLNNDIVWVSVRAHNGLYGNVDQAKVDALDKQWRDERKQEKKPLIASTLSSPLSVYLTRMQGQSLGLFVEIFVMNKKGLNVGQSSITSDFWQGDEAKFQKTFDVGPTAVFIDEPEWDEDNHIWRMQINKSLVDPANNELIGAATIEVNLTELERRTAAKAK
nr:hypothetical protein [uncultured Cohaesibacter sp.]